MICPHCAKRIDDELIDRYVGFVTHMESAAATMGRKGGRSRSPEKLAAIRRANQAKRVPDEVRAKILASDKTGAELSRELGLSQSIISRIRRGER